MRTAEMVAGTVAIQAIFYSGLAAPAVMALFWRWYRTRLGWSVAAKTIALSLALVPAMIKYWLGPAAFVRSDAVTWFTITMLYVVPAVVWWRVYEIYRVQRRGGPHI